MAAVQGSIVASRRSKFKVGDQVLGLYGRGTFVTNNGPRDVMVNHSVREILSLFSHGGTECTESYFML